MEQVFSSVPSMAERNPERTRKIHFIKTWLRGWCHHRIFFFFFYCWVVYLEPGLMATDRSHLSQRRK